MGSDWPTGVDRVLMTGISACTFVGFVWRDERFDSAIPRRLAVVVVGLACILGVRLASVVWARTLGPR